MKRSVKLLSVFAALILSVSLLSGCISLRTIFGFLNQTETEESSVDPTETEAPDKTAEASVFPSTEEPTEESTEEAVVRDENKAFKEFTIRYFVENLEGNTFSTHFRLAEPEKYGIDTSEVSWGTFENTDEMIEEYWEAIKEYREELASFDYDQLEWEGKLVYDCLDWYLQLEETSKGLDYYYEPFGPYAGLQSNLPLELAEYAFYREKDVQDYLELLRLFPDLIDEGIAYEQKRADMGLFMEDVVLEAALDQIDSFLAGKKDSFLLSSFENKLNELDIPAETKAAYIDENKDLVENAFYPAYEKLKSGLEALKGSNKHEGGLCNYPEGDRYYAYKLKSGTGSEMTPEEMIDRLDAQIESDIDEIIKIQKRKPSVYEVLLTTDYFPNLSPEETEEWLKDRIKDEFPAIEDVEYTISYVDESLRDYMNPACYMIPPIDRPELNSILINSEPGETSGTLYTTLAHEGYPGHLYQINYTREHSEYEVRWTLRINGYSEGYAKYVELMSYDYLDDLSKEEKQYLRLNDRLSILIYARVDLGIHYDGWTTKDIEIYLSNYFYSADALAEWMYVYMLDEPAVYEQYAIGMLEILDLEEEALASGMSEMEFRTKLLDCAGSPFSVIRKNILGE